MKELSELELSLMFHDEENIYFYMPKNEIWIFAEIETVKGKEQGNLFLNLSGFRQIKRKDESQCQERNVPA